MTTTTMGSLADWQPPPEDKEYYNNLLATMDMSYPEDWREWIVNERTYQDLFGENISAEMEARLRFAIPTIQLATIFSKDKPTCFSERRHRKIRRTLIKWPLGRALIYQPLSIMTKIHPVNVYNKFFQTLDTLKTGLLSRHDASEMLKKDANNGDKTRSMTSSPRSSKRTRTSPTMSEEPPSKRSKDEVSSGESLTDYMRQQNELLGKLCELTYEIAQRPQAVSAPTFSSPTKSYLSETSSHSQEWTPPPLLQMEKRDASEEEINEELLLDFTPITKEAEAKICKASEELATQGRRCQRFDNDGWRNIRYSEVQKQFQATPVFTALKVNSQLAPVTPAWQLVNVLEKMDLCLGAITHGLLQQRKAFQDICNNATPEVRNHISKNILSNDSNFRKTSDSLLQYTCGKRSEIIEQRRALYKPTNKTVGELLHDIPPSDTHLFSDQKLTEFVKDQGGTAKLFPGKFRKPTSFSRQRPGVRDHRMPEVKNKQQYHYSARPRQNQRAPESKTTRGSGKPATSKQRNSRGFETRKH